MTLSRPMRILEDVKKNPDNIRVSHESILRVRYISSKVTENAQQEICGESRT